MATAIRLAAGNHRSICQISPITNPAGLGFGRQPHLPFSSTSHPSSPIRLAISVNSNSSDSVPAFDRIPSKEEFLKNLRGMARPATLLAAAAASAIPPTACNVYLLLLIRLLVVFVSYRVVLRPTAEPLLRKVEPRLFVFRWREIIQWAALIALVLSIRASFHALTAADWICGVFMLAGLLDWRVLLLH